MRDKWTLALVAVLATTLMVFFLMGAAEADIHYGGARWCPDWMDTDWDGIGDRYDNCLDDHNPRQLDTDGDGYGNACDADIDNNGLVDGHDEVLMRIFVNWGELTGDLNEDGVTNVDDLSLFVGKLGSEPGPSGLISCPGVLFSWRLEELTGTHEQLDGYHTSFFVSYKKEQQVDWMWHTIVEGEYGKAGKRVFAKLQEERGELCGAKMAMRVSTWSRDERLAMVTEDLDMEPCEDARSL